MGLRELIASLKRDEGLKLYSVLSTKHYDAQGNEVKEDRRRGTRVVTDAFVNFLVDQLQSSTGEIAAFKWHASGEGTNAEAAGDTSLQTEVETRDSGTQTEGASANIYKSVATHEYGGSFAITEHGLLDADTAGTLLDRTVFGAVNVSSGEKIEFTYELTVSSGG